MHLEGYEYKEIGRKVGMTKNNVGIRLVRIKEKLREQMNNVLMR
jgi:DNA-directed RNA polymerase specialized sigma24 family protein